MNDVITQRDETKQKAERTAAIYAKMFVDILYGRNLDKHLQDVTKGIAVIDRELPGMIAENVRIDSIEELKNNLWRLKWMILERT